MMRVAVDTVTPIVDMPSKMSWQMFWACVFDIRRRRLAEERELMRIKQQNDLGSMRDQMRG